MTKRTKIIGALSGVTFIAIVAFAGWFLLLRGNGPDAATSTSAVEAVQEQLAVQEETEAATAPTQSGDAAFDGAWTLDTSFGVGEFPFDDSSYVGYRVVEELVSIGGFTAVGRTTSVAGSLEIEGSTIGSVQIEADLLKLTSDSRARDEVIKGQALESATFPLASFMLTSPIELGALPAAGETIAVQALGALTLHGVTNPVTVPLEATLVGDSTIAVVGTIPIAFADYNIDPPSAAIVASIEDEGEIELQLFFTNARVSQSE